MLMPLLNDSVKQLQFLQREVGTSLGLVKVEELIDFTMEPEEIENGPVQLRLYQNVYDLDPMPWRFIYRFKCAEDKCKGHRMTIIDWEIGALCRKAKEPCNTEKEILDYMADRFVKMMFSRDRETYFFLGTHRWHPTRFMVCGVLYFKKEP